MSAHETNLVLKLKVRDCQFAGYVPVHSYLELGKPVTKAVTVEKEPKMRVFNTAFTQIARPLFHEQMFLTR
jgi:hypothetical protein